VCFLGLYIAAISTGDNSSRDNCASFVIILVCNRKFLSENDTFYPHCKWSSINELTQSLAEYDKLAVLPVPGWPY